jgi:hypothetical protein
MPGAAGWMRRQRVRLSACRKRWGVWKSWQSVGLAEEVVEHEEAVDAKHNQPTSRAVGDLRSFLMVVARGWWGDVHLRRALSCLPNSCD